MLQEAVLDKDEVKNEEWKEGDELFSVSCHGDILVYHFDDDIRDVARSLSKNNNLYHTYKEAEMASKRDRLMRVNNTAKKGEWFRVWNFSSKLVVDSKDWLIWASQPKFATKEEAEEWGKSAQEVFEFFNK